MSFPYVANGTVTDSNRDAIASQTVTARNETTNNITSVTTNSIGQYVLDVANISGGYLTSDRITVYCNSGNEFKESSFLISDDTHLVNLQLEAITDSELIYYCTVQDIWDELGGKNATDISAHRVIKIVQRAESEIEDSTGTAWREVTVTDELYDINDETMYMSPERMYLRGYQNRVDYWRLNYSDTLKLNKEPIVSITTLERNTAGLNSVDNWDELTEQDGSGGDFILYKKEGLVKFVQNIPRYGKRSVKVTYIYGRETVPKSVERLTILLTVRDIILSKVTGSQFSNQKTISVDGLTVQGGITSGTSYLNIVNNEIDRLWSKVGSFKSVIA